MTTILFSSSPALEDWLKRATCRLSADSQARVRAEILEHYESACLEASSRGAAPKEAEHAALASLGDPNTANRQYRKVLVTSREAGLLREVKWESGVICSHPKLCFLPGAVLWLGIWLVSAGRSFTGWLLIVGSIGLGLLFAAPFLPIYTRRRSRIFRAVRWTWLAAVFAVAFWPNYLQQSWLIISCAWVILWVEWTMISLRRKIPVAQWPKQLYL